MSLGRAVLVANGERATMMREAALARASRDEPGRGGRVPPGRGYLAAAALHCWMRFSRFLLFASSGACASAFLA